ncbi:hypothetical protein BDZ91DRAFT_800314 [Kalaharituber pfeilii]|nr:hypothetical protein BDZ91DRAFT_800314 [Kalaharituber pfeilii]
METANVVLSSGSGNMNVSGKMKEQAKARAVSPFRPRQNDDDHIENVIVVCSPSETTTSSRNPAQFLAKSNSLSSLPVLTGGSPPGSLYSTTTHPKLETNTSGSFTPLKPSYEPHLISSPNHFNTLPHSALPFRPASFLGGFTSSSSSSIFGSPSSPKSSRRFETLSATDSVTMSPSTKRKRSSISETITLQAPGGILPTRSAGPDTIVISTDRGGLSEEKTDEDEKQNSGKRRRIKGIIKYKTELQIEAPTGSEGGELIGDMDRLSIENEVEESESAKELGNATSMTGSDDLEDSMMEGASIETGTIPEENTDDFEESSKDTAIDENGVESEFPPSRSIIPPRSRRRLRSPPPPIALKDDDEDEDNEESPEGSASMSPPLPPDSIIITSESNDDEDDEEDLHTGSQGAFYYKPTPAERYARSQKRMQQIREYKARESKEAREKRRRRRGSTSGVGSGAILGISGAKGSIRRKVHFAM